MTSVNDWVSFLRDVHPAGGFPMIIAGCVLMLFGWRIWKICVGISFGVIAFALAAEFAPHSEFWLYAIGGAMVLGLAAWATAKHSVVLLGGVLSAGIVDVVLSGSNLETQTLLGVLAISLIAGIAYSVINRQRVVILVTAFLGAVLLISGLTCSASALPGLSKLLQSIAVGNAIVIPFIILVPGVMSTFYQFAEVRRLQVDL